MSAPSSVLSTSQADLIASTSIVSKTDHSSWLSTGRSRTCVLSHLDPFIADIHAVPSDLQRRGCVRTAFEFARLLYSLDPWTDPHGALLHLDFLALKAGMGQWLLDVFGLFEARRTQRKSEPDSRMDPSLLPGWTYSRALALWMAEDAKKDKVYVLWLRVLLLR